MKLPLNYTKQHIRSSTDLSLGWVNYALIKFINPNLLTYQTTLCLISDIKNIKIQQSLSHLIFYVNFWSLRFLQNFACLAKLQEKYVYAVKAAEQPHACTPPTVNFLQFHVNIKLLRTDITPLLPGLVTSYLLFIVLFTCLLNSCYLSIRKFD